MGSSTSNTPDASSSTARLGIFQGAEIGILIETYRFVLSYLDCAPPLDARERNDLARLTLMAAFTRRKLYKGLSSFIDAHALAAEIVDIFLTLQDLDSLDVPKAPRILFCLEGP